MFKGLLPSLQSSPKNVIYAESWHLDELQSPYMGTGVSSSHQAKNQPLFSASHFALVGDGFLTILSIHEGRALGSTLNNSSLSCREQGNSCRVFSVMLLIFQCCSADRGDKGAQEPNSKQALTYFHHYCCTHELMAKKGGKSHPCTCQTTTRDDQFGKRCCLRNLQPLLWMT